MTIFLIIIYFLKLVFIGVELIYNVVLVSAVQQSQSYTCIHSFFTQGIKSDDSSVLCNFPSTLNFSTGTF